MFALGMVASLPRLRSGSVRSHSGGTEGENGVTPGSVQGPWVRKTHSHQGSLRDMEEQRHWWDHGTPPQKPRGDSVIMGDDLKHLIFTRMRSRVTRTEEGSVLVLKA